MASRSFSSSSCTNEEIPSELQCQICLELADDPVQHGGASGCGKVYCKACYDNLIMHAIDQKCPNCRRPLNSENMFHDPRAAREIKNLKEQSLKRPKDNAKVECRYKCEKKGIIRVLSTKNISKHYVSECPRRPFKCPRCPVTGEFQKMMANHSEVCEMAMIKCPNRKCDWEGVRKSLGSHLQSCSFGVVDCPNMCQQKGKTRKIMRKEIISHLDVCSRRKEKCRDCGEEMEHRELIDHPSLCPEAPIKCSNKGCKKIFPRSKTADHRDNCDYQPVPCQYARYGCKTKPPKKDLAMHEEEDLSRIMLPLGAFIDEQNKANLEKSQLEDSIRTHKSCITSKNIEITRLTRELAEKDNQMRELQSSTTPCRITISDFSWKRAANDKYLSRSFYLADQSYKLCLKVYLNGRRDGAGSHISVHLHLMKGPFDRRLRWPMQESFTVSLLNQYSDDNHFEQRQPFTFSRRSRASKRLRLREISSNGIGYDRYIANEVLQRGGPGIQYIRNDCLVFRVKHNAD